MAKLNLSVAVGDYDRNRPLIDGAVQIDGVDPVFMKLYPEEIFFRAFRSQDFDWAPPYMLRRILSLWQEECRYRTEVTGVVLI